MREHPGPTFYLSRRGVETENWNRVDRPRQKLSWSISEFSRAQRSTEILGGNCVIPRLFSHRFVQLVRLPPLFRRCWVRCAEGSSHCAERVMRIAARVYTKACQFSRANHVPMTRRFADCECRARAAGHLLLAQGPFAYLANKSLECFVHMPNMWRWPCIV